MMVQDPRHVFQDAEQLLVIELRNLGMALEAQFLGEASH
jgi:hypothetical protein